MEADDFHGRQHTQEEKREHGQYESSYTQKGTMADEERHLPMALSLLTNLKAPSLLEPRNMQLCLMLNWLWVSIA
jgi:hypothetical protein